MCHVNVGVLDENWKDGLTNVGKITSKWEKVEMIIYISIERNYFWNLKKKLKCTILTNCYLRTFMCWNVYTSMCNNIQYL